MALDFTAIDFETANFFLGSPCAIGMVKVKDGKMIDGKELYFKPPAGYDSFDRRNIKIHGIEAEDLVDQFEFYEILPKILEYIEDDIIVAHNISFDATVLSYAAQVSGLSYDAFTGACTVAMSRKFYELPSNSLPFAAEESGYDLVNHHNALEDARASGHIMIDIARKNNVDSVENLYELAGKKLYQVPAYDHRLGLDSKTKNSVQKFNNSHVWL